jgi:rubrerythrin
MLSNLNACRTIKAWSPDDRVREHMLPMEVKVMADKDEKDERPYWKCSDCGYTVQDNQPPEKCPMCQHTCEFINVTCYAPECGFTGIDPRLK